jgi:outer membrane lipoprotein-sorting protein
VVISSPSQSVEIALRYTSVEVNRGISKTAFLLPVPSGVEIIDLDKQKVQ